LLIFLKIRSRAVRRASAAQLFSKPQQKFQGAVRKGCSSPPCDTFICLEGRVIAKCKRLIENVLKFFFIAFQSACKNSKNPATARVCGASGKKWEKREKGDLGAALP